MAFERETEAPVRKWLRVLKRRARRPRVANHPARSGDHPGGGDAAAAKTLCLCRRLMVCRFLMLALFTFGFKGVGHASAGAAPWGKTVLHIDLQTDAQLSASDFKDKITQKIGEPLDASKVSQSLKNLYATRRFLTLRAETKGEAGGVDLIFAGDARFFIGTVTINETGKALSPDALASGARLTLGQSLSVEDLEGASGRIQSLLASNGYYRAHVHYTEQRNFKDPIANIVFTVVTGPPATLGEVKFQGTAQLSQARLAAIAGWRRGAHLTSAQIQHGLSLLREYFTRRGHLEATANMARRVYDPAHNTEMIVVKLNPGPRVLIHVEGARISTSQLKKTLPIYRDGLTDDLSLDAGTQRLLDYFEQKGYFSANAHWRRIPHPGEFDITYAVDLGRPAAFEGYDFQGNHGITPAELRPLVTIQPASFPSHTHGVFSETMLDHDVKALTAYYQSQGFLQARVTPDLRKKEGELFVTFHVREGALTRVGNLTFNGVDAQTAKQLQARMQALSGRAYSPARISKDRNSILTYFANRGFSQASVTARASPALHERMNVEYQIQPGPQEIVRSIVVMGNLHTRMGVIRRQLTIRSGEPLSQTQIFESQRRLYDLGLFNSVQIAPLNPNGAETKKTVLVAVQEAKRWTLGYGFGIDMQRLGGNQPQGQFGASPRLSLDLTRIDVGGRDQTFSLRGRLSDLETGGETSYLIPSFLRRPSLTFHADGIVDQARNILTFTSTVEQASLTVEKRYSSSTFILGRYNYRHVTLSNLRINSEEVPLQSQPVRDAGFETSFVHDTRDNPADATRGSYSLLDASISATHLGSEASYARSFGQNSTYHRLKGHLIFARNTELGVESPYGPPREITIPGAIPSTILTQQLPLADEFFAGGSDSLRAFSLNDAGPRDPVTGYPIGGNALFVNQFELRVPFRQGRYGLVFFNDAGNVYSSISDMRLLKFAQTSPTDLNYTVQALGVGFRYKTPVGPVRLDLAYDLNTPLFQTMPHPHTSEVQRLPAFQYFISIGQSF